MRRNHRFKMASVSTSAFSLWLLLVGISLLTSGVSAVCPTGCICDDENLQVNCADGAIDFIPITLNPYVQKLILKSNRIRSVDHNGFSFYPSLTHIDLSHNHLLKIQPQGFSVQTRLVHLNLSNNKVSSLGNQTFGGAQGNREGLPALAILNLHDNILDTIEPGVFKYTKNLEELDLSKNALRDLNTSAFQGLRNLRILRLDNNGLVRVPPAFSAKSGPIEMSLLRELFLGMNTISRLNNDAFSGLKNLETLDLKGCRVSAIEINAFRGLESLRKLVLTDNDLSSVPTMSFSAIPNLEILRMGRNPILQIGSLAFGALKKMKNLEMSGVPELQMIEEDAFATNLNLETVQISTGKKLSILPGKLFKGISSLKSLDLQENALTSLPEDLVSWQSLRHIRLEGNPLRCTCDLLWLRDLLMTERFINSSFLVICDQPVQLRDRRVTSLAEKDMNCYINGPVQKTILGISIAVAIILLVLFFFFMYRYHDRIKNTCKRKCFRNRRGSRSSRGGPPGKGQRGSTSSAAVKAAELNNSTKTSFLSHSSAYPYSDEEFAIRASLMSTSPQGHNGGYAPSGAYSSSNNHHPLSYNNPSQSYSLQRGMPPPIPHMPVHGNYNMHSLGHQAGLGHNSHPPPHYPSEYETPHVHLGNNLGVSGLNLNYQQHYSPGLDHGMRYNPQQQQLVKPIPITEL